MKIYEKLLRKLFAQAIKHEVSAIQTRMMKIESENKELKAENQRLREAIKVYSDVHDKNIAAVAAKTKLAFGRMGHTW